MLELALKRGHDAPLQILCIGAHSDDIEIGCGGTILRLLNEYPQARVCWVVLSATPARAIEAQRSAEYFLVNAKERDIVVKDFADGFFPYDGAEIKRFFEELKGRISPDLIFTHRRQDMHQDHRVTNELTWNTFRDHLIWEYEIPKYDGDLTTPNLYVTLDEATCQQKIDYLLSCFQTQTNKYWFNSQTFLALATLRGVEARSMTGFAEGFHARKVRY